jgi:phosphocarrier protein
LKELSYTITDPDGIHARPAGILVKRMQEFPCNITITSGEKKADGKRLFALMKMAVKKGMTITITAEGEDEDSAIAAVAETLREAGL